MAAFREGNYISRQTAVDHTLNTFKITKLDAGGKVVLASAATDVILGVLEQGGKAGETVSVALINGNGTFKVKLGGTVAAGSNLTTDANGLAVTAATGNTVFGRALSAGVSGDVIEYIKRDAVA